MTYFLLKMSATLFVKLQRNQGWLPLIQSVRHGSKAVTRHKKPVHFFKQKLIAVTRYIPPARSIPPGAYPSEKQLDQEDNEFVSLLKKNLEEVFEESKMIAVVQTNSCRIDDMLMLKHRLCKHGIKIKHFPNQVMLSFLSNSVYSKMTPLFMGPTVLFVSKEPKVKEMMSALRVSPQMTLLAACIDNTLLSPQGVVRYTKLPSLTVVQGELVSGLTMLTSQTAFMLQRHPAHLSALLQQYIKQQSPDDGAEATPKAEEAS